MKPNTKFHIVVIFAVAAATLTTFTAAEQMPPPPPREQPEGLALDHRLYRAEQAWRARQDSPAQRIQALNALEVKLFNGNMVNVEIVAPDGKPAVTESDLEPFGATVRYTWRRWVDAFVPIDRLSDMAASLPDGYQVLDIRRAVPMSVEGEGPAAVNSVAYRDAGRDGSGINIAVMDGGFVSLDEAVANGDAPSSYTEVNYNPAGFEGDSEHGTACVERAYDHAPGANWFLYNISGGIASLGSAIDHAIANDMDIISLSQGYYGDGWHDDEGGSSAAIQAAADADILCFLASGNSGHGHWQGWFDPGPDLDGWHDWEDGDETIAIGVPESTAAEFNLVWNRENGLCDYDLYLYNEDRTVVLESSTSVLDVFERILFRNTGDSITVKLAVSRKYGDTEFEIYMNGLHFVWLEHLMRESSTVSPTNTTHTNAISVGAVLHDLYEAPGNIEYYSSRGPSNDGMILPTIVGPTGTTGYTYDGDPYYFLGTSGSTPNAAGATAAFWSSDPQLNATAISYLIREQAAVFADWGAPGQDNTYGYGAIMLVDYAPNTLWISRKIPNFDGNRWSPYFFVQDAHDAAVAGGRLLLIPGGTFPEPVSLTKQLDIFTLGGSAVLGSN